MVESSFRLEPPWTRPPSSVPEWTAILSLINQICQEIREIPSYHIQGRSIPFLLSVFFWAFAEKWLPRNHRGDVTSSLIRPSNRSSKVSSIHRLVYRRKSTHANVYPPSALIDISRLARTETRSLFTPGRPPNWFPRV
jgi:hypothetical protein